MERKQLLLIQVILTALIFLIFASGIFITTAYLPYLLLSLIIANIVLIFINKTKGLFININLLWLASLLFVFLLEYFASIGGTVLSFIHALKITLKYFKEK